MKFHIITVAIIPNFQERKTSCRNIKEVDENDIMRNGRLRV
jgi:hypothetical protein